MEEIILKKKFLKYVAGLCMGLSFVGVASGTKAAKAMNSNVDPTSILTLISSMNISENSAKSLIQEFVKVDYINLSDSDKKIFDSIRNAVADFAKSNKLSSTYENPNMDKEKQYDEIAGLLWNLIYGSTRWATDIATMTLNHLGMDYSGFAGMLSSVSSKVNFPLDVKNSSTDVVVEEVAIVNVGDVLSKIDFSSLDAKTIVNGLYNTIFSRNADESGLNFWVGQIERGIRDGKAIQNVIEEIALKMLNSNEARNVK